MRRRRRSNFALDAVNCLAGGVFLATSLLHMLPDVRHDVATALRAISDAGFPTHTDFPMAEFITSVGFLVVLLFEEVVSFINPYSPLRLINQTAPLGIMSMRPLTNPYPPLTGDKNEQKFKSLPCKERKVPYE